MLTPMRKLTIVKSVQWFFLGSVLFALSAARLVALIAVYDTLSQRSGGVVAGFGIWVMFGALGAGDVAVMYFYRSIFAPLSSRQYHQSKTVWTGGDNGRHRTLVVFTSLDGELMVNIPAWEPHAYWDTSGITMPVAVYDLVSQAAARGRLPVRCHARVNLGAVDFRDLTFDEWELS